VAAELKTQWQSHKKLWKDLPCAEFDDLVALVDDRNGYPDGLINHLRQDAGTMKATSWEDYWERARPVFRKYFAERQERELVPPTPALPQSVEDRRR